MKQSVPTLKSDKCSNPSSQAGKINKGRENRQKVLDLPLTPARCMHLLRDRYNVTSLSTVGYLMAIEELGDDVNFLQLGQYFSKEGIDNNIGQQARMWEKQGLVTLSTRYAQASTSRRRLTFAKLTPKAKDLVRTMYMLGRLKSEGVK